MEAPLRMLSLSRSGASLWEFYKGLYKGLRAFSGFWVPGSIGVVGFLGGGFAVLALEFRVRIVGSMQK